MFVKWKNKKIQIQNRFLFAAFHRISHARPRTRTKRFFLTSISWAAFSISRLCLSKSSVLGESYIILQNSKNNCMFSSTKVAGNHVVLLSLQPTKFTRLVRTWVSRCSALALCLIAEQNNKPYGKDNHDQFRFPVSF